MATENPNAYPLYSVVDGVALVTVTAQDFAILSAAFLSMRDPDLAMETAEAVTERRLAAEQQERPTRHWPPRKPAAMLRGTKGHERLETRSTPFETPLTSDPVGNEDE